MEKLRPSGEDILISEVTIQKMPLQEDIQIGPEIPVKDGMVISEITKGPDPTPSEPSILPVPYHAQPSRPFRFTDFILEEGTQFFLHLIKTKK